MFEGFKATKYLLKNSKPLKGEMKFMDDDRINEFKKGGGKAQAYHDFRAIKPKDIRRSGSVSKLRHEKPYLWVSDQVRHNMLHIKKRWLKA